MAATITLIPLGAAALALFLVAHALAGRIRRGDTVEELRVGRILYIGRISRARQ